MLTDLAVANGVSTLLGGGILNGGSLTVERSHVTGNAAPGDTDGRGGGGIFNDGGAKLVLESSTVSDNRAGSNGGGIFNADGTVTVDSSTLSGNAAGTGAGGIGGSRTITVADTLIANNTPSDCGPALASAGHNLLRDPTGCTLEGDTTGNVVGGRASPRPPGGQRRSDPDPRGAVGEPCGRRR